MRGRYDTYANASRSSDDLETTRCKPSPLQAWDEDVIQEKKSHVRLDAVQRQFFVLQPPDQSVDEAIRRPHGGGYWTNAC
jgi:hypothetical protein